MSRVTLAIDCGNMRGMSKLVYSVHIEPLPKTGFYITVPALPQCRTTAKSFDSALKKARIQIEKHLKALVKARKPIPMESQKVRPLCLPIRVNLPPGARTILSSELMSA
jgi:predicted RNase H-like HicB family nuclease